jgi:hypothetical protein
MKWQKKKTTKNFALRLDSETMDAIEKWQPMNFEVLTDRFNGYWISSQEKWPTEEVIFSC